DPRDSLVHWRPLLIPDSIEQTEVWLSRQAGLEQLVHRPFFLAFRYQAPGGMPSGGRSLDSIRVTEYTSGIGRFPNPRKTADLQVVGEATTNEINFRISLERAGKAEVFLY